MIKEYPAPGTTASYVGEYDHMKRDNFFMLFVPFRQRKTGTSFTPISGLKNGLKNSGCPWISVASGRL
jgi:hypothetical protein